MMIDIKSVLTIGNNGKIFTVILPDFGFNFNFNLRISNFTFTSNLKLKLNPKYYLLNGKNTSCLYLGSDLVAYVAY